MNRRSRSKILLKFRSKTHLKKLRNKHGYEVRTVTVSKLTEGLGFMDVGIRVFEGIDSNEQRRNHEDACLRALKVKMRSLSTYVV